jgi:hypothetical protein
MPGGGCSGALAMFLLPLVSPRAVICAADTTSMPGQPGGGWPKGRVILGMVWRGSSLLTAVSASSGVMRDTTTWYSPPAAALQPNNKNQSARVAVKG